MNAEELKRLQAPLKDEYRINPDKAVITLRAQGALTEGISCKVDTGKAIVEAGLHPATGGTGMLACSGDLLLEALVACAGVTLKAVATAIGIDIPNGEVSAEGDLDFKGTLGVSRDAPVGFREIRLTFNLNIEIEQEKLDALKKLTERYCVVYQTIKSSTSIESIFK